MKTRDVGWRYRTDVVARVAAATGGGYAVAALIAIACAWALPGQRIDAAAFGVMIALLAIPVAAMGCFWARSAWRAWAAILIFGSTAAGVAWAAGWRP